jgi:hypothetical protein
MRITTITFSICSTNAAYDPKHGFNSDPSPLVDIIIGDTEVPSMNVVQRSAE